MPIDKIIVVEDDAIVRRNLEQQLRQQRYEVAGSGTLAGVRELMERDTFDLIFLDVRLPDGEGTDLLKRTPVPSPKAAGRHHHRVRLGGIGRGLHAQRRV
jgi:DNA-binding NtrC family response regulator